MLNYRFTESGQTPAAAAGVTERALAMAGYCYSWQRTVRPLATRCQSTAFWAQSPPARSLLSFMFGGLNQSPARLSRGCVAPSGSMLSGHLSGMAGSGDAESRFVHVSILSNVTRKSYSSCQSPIFLHGAGS